MSRLILDAEDMGLEKARSFGIDGCRDGACDVPGDEVGQGVSRLFCSDSDRDGDVDGAVADPRVVAEAWDAWRAEVEFATRFVAEAPSLDITGDDPLNQHGSGGGPMSAQEM